MSAPALTPRKLEVAQLVGQGYTTKAIAAALGVGERTVQEHIEGIARTVSDDTTKDPRVLIARWWWDRTHAA